MLQGLHVLLTYSCTRKCDHCFVHGGPEAGGAFTLAGLRDLLREAARIESLRTVYFEGGEPFLFYPLLVEGVRLVRGLGLEAGIVTNGYWAGSPEDAALWLEPLRRLGISDLSVSDDELHGSSRPGSAAKTALAAALDMGMPADSICIDKDPAAGEVMYRGRAAETLAPGLAQRASRTLTTCPHEDLTAPERVHVDAFGNVHICQGLVIGNFRRQPLSEIVRDYDPRRHPICGPLVEGGPAHLAEVFDAAVEPGYADECHLCYSLRKVLAGRFPQWLAPRQVYGWSDSEDESARKGESLC